MRTIEEVIQENRELEKKLKESIECLKKKNEQILEMQILLNAAQAKLDKEPSHLAIVNSSESVKKNKIGG